LGQFTQIGELCRGSLAESKKTFNTQICADMWRFHVGQMVSLAEKRHRMRRKPAVSSLRAARVSAYRRGTFEPPDSKLKKKLSKYNRGKVLTSRRGRIFVCQQGGALRVIKNGALLPAPFLTVTVDSSGERGLLGVAFDPNFVSNQLVYVYYTATTPTFNAEGVG
jgi:glucose/arabinose dehydrogenase